MGEPSPGHKIDPSLNMRYCAKKKNEQFLPSFKQLQKNGDCDGWRELSETTKCDSYSSLENKVQSSRLGNSIKSRDMVILVDHCI